MAPPKKKRVQKTDVPLIKDSRFSDMHSAPIFKRMKAEKHKVALDPRFASVLNDDSFRVSEGKIDKYGRKQTKSEAKDELSSFYAIDDEDDDDDHYDEDEELAEAEADVENSKELSGKRMKPKPKQIKRQKFKPGEKLPTTEVEKRLMHLNRMARGELESDEESDSDSSESEDNDDFDEDVLNSENDPVQVDPLPEGGETKRLAVCNLDWDHLGAVDILSLMESFIPAGGSIVNVSVYPSDYGLEKIEHEERFGPQIATQQADSGDDDSDDDSDDDELGELEGGDGGERKKLGVVFADSDSDSELVAEEGLPGPVFGSKRKGKAVVAGGYGKTLDYDEEELRAYEIQRSKYYFGVVVCADVATASGLYDQVNRMEWEYSSTTIDLSFIPDELDLSDRRCKETATSVPEGYQAPEFVSSAKQQSKVSCTWDEDDPNRTRELDRLNDWTRVNENEDISHLVAGEESSDSEDGEKDRNKMRRLMGFGGDSDSDLDDAEDLDEPEMDEEDFNFITTNPSKEMALRGALEERSKRGQHEESPWEKTQRKLAEKKKSKKEARKAKLSGLADENNGESLVRNATDKEFFLASDEETDPKPMKKSKAEKKSTVVEDDGVEDDSRNYDMRAVVRAEKMKGKKLKGARARKEAKRLAEGDGLQTVDGSEAFVADVKDDRFSALLDGDSRFGLDPTSSSFKQTEGMKAIIAEQRKRRSKKSSASKATGPKSEKPSDSKHSDQESMTSLVSSLKRRALAK